MSLLSWLKNPVKSLLSAIKNVGIKSLKYIAKTVSDSLLNVGMSFRTIEQNLKDVLPDLEDNEIKDVLIERESVFNNQEFYKTTKKDVEIPLEKMTMAKFYINRMYKYVVKIFVWDIEKEEFGLRYKTFYDNKEMTMNKLESLIQKTYHDSRGVSGTYMTGFELKESFFNVNKLREI